jgi:hypothetical protein
MQIQCLLMMNASLVSLFNSIFVMYAIYDLLATNHSTYGVETYKKQNCISHMSVWDVLCDIYMFWRNKAVNRLHFSLMRIQCLFMMNASHVWLLDYIMQFKQFMTFKQQSIARMVKKHTRITIALFICQLGTIQVTFTCFDEIWRQIDSILVLCKFNVFLWWMHHMCDYWTILCNLWNLWPFSNKAQHVWCRNIQEKVTFTCFGKIWRQIDSILV